MTETEWLVCEDPSTMLAFLQSTITERKLRLLACACCRAVWDETWPQRSRNVVLTVELFADDLATEQELNRSRSLACQSAQSAVRRGSRRRFGHSGWSVESRLFFAADAALARHNFKYIMTVEYPRMTRGITRIWEITPAILRELLGIPHRPVALDAKWSTSDVLALATQMYASRDFSAMPILADALQDAGCDNTDILDHCRDTSLTHVRGCWVVDRVLGRN